MSFFDSANVINQQVKASILSEKNIQLFVKREDTINPDISGNKYRKLKYNLKLAKEKGFAKIVTFGGAFSNHILATAVAGNLVGLQTVGIIRGEELGENIKETLSLNPTLKKAYDGGMKFEFISRKDYREKMNSAFIERLEKKYGAFYLLPEGGTNRLAVKGCEEILTEQDIEFDYICCCVGTGGTLAGIINSAKNHQKVLGFPALKGGFLREEISGFVENSAQWNLITDYHFGGYAKYTEELIRFINDFKRETFIPLDPIYTGKMMFGVFDMIKKNQFPESTKILAVHTGGLQGIEGFNEVLKKKKTGLKVV